MNRFSGPLAGFRSQLQIAHPYDIEDLVEYKVELFGSNFHRLETFSVPEGHPSKRYLEYRSHDARIRGFTVAPDCLKLELNDYDGWRLAGAFEQRLGRPVSRSRLKPKVPVTLSFTGLRHWKVFQYEASGKLIRVKHSLKSNLSRMDEYVGDTVLQFNRSGISLILEARVSPYESN